MEAAIIIIDNDIYRNNKTTWKKHTNNNNNMSVIKYPFSRVLPHCTSSSSLYTSYEGKYTDKLSLESPLLFWKTWGQEYCTVTGGDL